MHFVEDKLPGVGGVQAVKFHRINGVDKLGRVVFVGCQNGCVVLRKIAVDASQLDILRIPVVLVLLKGNDVVHFVGGHAEGTHADVGFRLGGPDSFVIRNSFLHRIEDGESSQVLEVGGGRQQLHGEDTSLVIRGDVQVIGIAFDDFIHEAIVSAQGFRSAAAPGEIHV